MANIFQSHFRNIMVPCLTTVAFTTAKLTPPPLMAANFNINLNAINFGIKVEKVFEKNLRDIKLVAYSADKMSHL